MTEPSKKINYTAKGATPDPAETPEKVVKPIEGITAVKKKQGMFSRVKENFTGEDAESVIQYVVFEVLLPSAKTALSDAVSQGFERLLFGESRPRSSAYRPGGGTTTNYQRYASQPKADPREARTRERRSNDFGDIIVETRGQAEETLERLHDLIQMYNVATVADLYELVAISGNFTDNKWGWTNLNGSRVQSVREGYLVVLPRPVPID